MKHFFIVAMIFQWKPVKLYSSAFILNGKQILPRTCLVVRRRPIVKIPLVEVHREQCFVHRMSRNEDINPGRFDANKDFTSKDEKQTTEAPTVQNIIKFAIPAIGIWLCGPVLSLIDTSAVGMMSGTSQLAALNPAITITDDGALLASFMYTATTNIVAATAEKDRILDGNLTSLTIATALQLAVFVGVFFGLGLGTSSRFFVDILLGKNANNLEVASAAAQYVKIRALGMPAAVLIGTAQSACLGMKDNRSPLLVMIAAALVNLIGDIIFVPKLGSSGAAWATVLSQYAAVIIFMKWLNRKPLDKNVSNDKEAISTRGILFGSFNFSDLFKLPRSMEIAKKFWEYAVPVTTTAIGRVSGYVAMSHVVCYFGTADMAAQQILLSFFLCFVPMCDSLNLTAQSFVPGIHEIKADWRHRAETMKQTVTNFMKAGGIFGFVLAFIASCLPIASRFCTRDPAVIASVTSCTPYVVFYCALSGVVCAGEGLLLARKDLDFLKNSFSVFFFAVPYFLLRLKKSLADVSLSKQVGLHSAWAIFAAYQIIRSFMWIARLLQLSYIDDSDVASQIPSKLKTG